MLSARRSTTVVCLVAIVTVLAGVGPAVAVQNTTPAAVTGESAGTTASQVSAGPAGGGVNVTYGDPARDEGVFAAVQANDGYVLGARVRTTTETGSEIDGLLARLGSDGTVRYERSLETKPTIITTAEGLAPAHGGGVVLGGSSDPFIIVDGEPRQGRLVAVDDDGETRWTRTYRNGTDVYDVAQIDDGGYVVVGRYSDPESDETGSAAWVAEVDADGDVEWDRTLTHDDPTVSPVSSFSAVTTTADGDVVAVGGAGSIFGVRNVYAVRLDGTGATAWERVVNRTVSDVPLDVTATDAGLVVAGYGTVREGDGTANTGFVLGLAADGSQRYAAEYPERTAMLDTVAPVAGGTGVLVGGGDGPGSNTLAASVVLSLDETGDLRWNDRPGGDRGVDLLNVTPDRYTLVAQVGADGSINPDSPSRDALITSQPAPQGVTPPPTDDVSAPPALPDGDGAATDPDNDGLYEDVNGDGRFSILDVVDFLAGFDTTLATDNTAAFDFDGSGQITILDVNALLQDV
jgi:PKD repeat protein